MEFLRRKTFVTIAVVLMMLLVSEANEVEGVKEPASKQDTSKDEHLLKENSSKEVAAEKKAAEQGGEGEASAGKDEKKPQEETSDAKDGGDDDVNGIDEGHSGSELEKSPASTKDNGEATSPKSEDVPQLNITTLDQSNNLTTILNPTLLTNFSEPDATVNGMDKSTESYDSNKSAVDDDTTVSDGTTIGSSSSASSVFVASGSASSSSPPADVQELPPPGNQKATESNDNNRKEDSGPGNVVSNNDQPKTAKLEETSNDENKKVSSQEEAAAKVADPAQETDVESDISKKEEDVMDVNAPEVKEESKVDTPLETSFEKQMGSGAADPPQSNFFSYFIVLAIITIIAYLVFHNKKKIVGLIVEGRSGRQAGRRRSGGREYRKLDSNVEDMMETGRETSMRQVIY